MLYGSLKVPGGFHTLRLQRAFTLSPEPGPYIDEAGNFFFRDLPPGKYSLSGFYKDGRLHLFQSLMTAGEAHRFVFEVKAGELKYANSWEVTGMEPGAFGAPGSFSLEDRQSPTPEEILRSLLPGVEGSAWESKVHAASARQGPTSPR